MKNADGKVTVLILAGARPGQDPVAELAGVPCKVLAKVGGEPMVARVLRATRDAETVNARIICGPSWEIVKEQAFLMSAIESGQLGWEAPQEGPSGSVRAFLEKYPHHVPLLVTTGDHALLTPAIVDYFVKEAQGLDVDVAFGIVSHSLVKAAFPATKRTVIRMGNDGFCGCNLFLLKSVAATRLVKFWSRLERDRKHPIRMIRHLGAGMVLRYLLGGLTLADCLENLGNRLNLRIREVRLPFPEAAVDVDKPEDLHFVENILAQERTPPEMA